MSIGRSGRLSEATAVTLERLGVAAAIESLADEVEVPDREIRTKLYLAFEEGRAVERLHRELEESIYRIVEEGVRNAVQEVDASCVLVEVIEDVYREEVNIKVSSLPGHRVRVSAVLPSSRPKRSMLNID